MRPSSTHDIPLPPSSHPLISVLYGVMARNFCVPVFNGSRVTVSESHTVPVLYSLFVWSSNRLGIHLNLPTSFSKLALRVLKTSYQTEPWPRLKPPGICVLSWPHSSKILCKVLCIKQPLQSLFVEGACVWDHHYLASSPPRGCSSWLSSIL